MPIEEKKSLIFGFPGTSFFDDFKRESVFVAELRPGLEGMRQVSALLLERKITPVMICDNMMAFCMKQGLVDKVYLFGKKTTGKNILCRTGSLIAALCAKVHRIPVVLYPCAKEALDSGQEDLHRIGAKLVTKENIPVYSPAWEDVDLELITENKSHGQL